MPLDGKRTAESGVPRLLFQLTRDLRTAFERRVSAFGVTFQQATLLIRCARQPGAQLNKLVPHLGTDNAGASRLVDRLEEAGLARRSDGADRRSIALTPTAAGLALVPQLERALGDVDRQLTRGLTQKETEQATALLRRMLANLGGAE